MKKCTGFDRNQLLKAGLWAATIGLASAVVAPASAQLASGLVSYRAGYTFELNQAKSSSGLLSLNGASFVEWVNVCDGYTLNQNTRSSYHYIQGGRADSAFTASTWEAKDGTNYRFVATHKVNGEVTTALEGRVDRGEPGDHVMARVTAGREDQEVALNSATLFPTGYTRRLISAALDGKQMIKDFIFDGSETDLEFQYVAVAFLLKENELNAEGEDTHPALRDVRSWPVRIAYFIDDGVSAVPDYEVGYDMYENGITTHLVLDYGDYTITGNMERLEVLDQVVCD